MASIYNQRELSPKLLTYGILIGGILALIYALLFQKIALFFIICGIPLVIICFIYSNRYPRIGYGIYAMLSYYLTTIMRYSHHDGLSVILDILLIYIFISVLFNISIKNKTILFSNAFNTLTIGYAIWALFLLLVFTHTSVSQKDMIMGIRGWLLGIPILYILSSILADNKKTLKNGLILIGIFTITAFLKLIYQKYRGFDSTEIEWLLDGNWGTHLLSTGIRYFSIFSDAGNFGASMGLVTIVYAIITFHTQNRLLRLFYLTIAIMGAIGMIMSGTRGALIVPFGGLMLYCLLSKNIRIILISSIVGTLLYLFFAFTDIGNDNPFIRRMRTAFHPTEDASFNVRIENQILIRQFILEHPWGTGIGGKIPRIMQQGDFMHEDTVPPDSFYVNIWIQTGYGGLSLYIAIYTIVILRCCFVVMFRIKDEELRHILAALLCGVFGMHLNGYVGSGMGMPPNNFFMAAAFAFILNGPYIDRQLIVNRKNIKN